MSGEFTLKSLCETLGVSRSGYYDWQGRAPSQRAQANQAVLARIETCHAASLGTYGSPRIKRELERHGPPVGLHRIARLMRQAHLQGRTRRRFRIRTTDSNHAEPIAPNLLAVRPAPSGPDQIWATDLTYIPTNEGWLYLAGCFGWFGWCLNYLLLFAAAHDQNVGEHIMITYAESELSTIFLIQPFTIVATIFAYWLLQRNSARIPEWLKTLLLVSSVNSIPSLYYFSDPWNHMSHTSFTAEFAYNIFIKAAATASGVDELAYAPMSAIAAHVGGLDGVEEGQAADAVANLYGQMWKEWIAIQSH